MKPAKYKGQGAATELLWVSADFPPQPGLTVLIQYVSTRRKFTTYHQAWHDGERWHYHDCTVERLDKQVIRWAKVHQDQIIEGDQ